MATVANGHQLVLENFVRNVRDWKEFVEVIRTQRTTHILGESSGPVQHSIQFMLNFTQSARYIFKY